MFRGVEMHARDASRRRRAPVFTRRTATAIERRHRRRSVNRFGVERRHRLVVVVLADLQRIAHVLVNVLRSNGSRRTLIVTILVLCVCVSHKSMRNRRKYISEIEM